MKITKSRVFASESQNPCIIELFLIAAGPRGAVGAFLSNGLPLSRLLRPHRSLQIRRHATGRTRSLDASRVCPQQPILRLDRLQDCPADTGTSSCSSWRRMAESRCEGTELCGRIGRGEQYCVHVGLWTHQKILVSDPRAFWRTPDSREYDGRPHLLRPWGPSVGTFPYAPLSSLGFCDQTPSDDVEGWLYMVIHLLTGGLPWHNSKRSLNLAKVREWKMYCRLVCVETFSKTTVPLGYCTHFSFSKSIQFCTFSCRRTGGRHHLFHGVPQEWADIFEEIISTAWVFFC